ncbi:MAG: glycosyltransferase family 9 protein [Proteobacteria bacterium]|nr:glycosyltransferase family 9 protein [Pseudomonadota bacterium]
MRRILVIQNKRIGDVILTAPVLDVLRSTFPKAKLSVVMDSTCRGVDALLPGIEPLYFCKRRLNFHFWRHIFLRPWDLCLEFTGTDRGVLVAGLSMARIRATYKRHGGSAGRRMAFNRFMESDVKNRHTVDYHLDLLKGLGIQTEGARRGISVSSDRVQAMRELLSGLGVGPHFAVIHPGSARSEKMWGVDNWIRTAEFLISTANLDVVLTGGAHSDELEQIGDILSRSSGSIFSVAGETTLDMLAATLALARVYVGVDTGAAHMADALGIPCAVLFGSTNPLHWGPRGEQGRAVGASGFSSYPHSFPKSSMQEIPVANVEAAIISALSKG